MTEVAAQIDAVRRTVGRRAVDGHEVHVLALEQDLPATRGALWAALTRPDALSRWFLPVSGELRTGGRFRLEGNAEGTIERCEPGEALRASWEFGGTVGRIEVALSDAGERRTRLALEHESPADDETWATYGPGASGVGWDLSLLGLVLHLAADGGSTAGEGWAGEEDGGRFIELSGEAWYAADVVGGADWTEARLRADRTVEAYTAPADEAG